MTTLWEAGQQAMMQMSSTVIRHLALHSVQLLSSLSLAASLLQVRACIQSISYFYRPSVHVLYECGHSTTCMSAELFLVRLVATVITLNHPDVRTAVEC